MQTATLLFLIQCKNFGLLLLLRSKVFSVYHQRLTFARFAFILSNKDFIFSCVLQSASEVLLK